MRILNATGLAAVLVLLASCLDTPERLREVRKGTYVPYYERDCAHLYVLYFDRLAAPDRTKVHCGSSHLLIDGCSPAVEQWTSSPTYVASPYGLQPGTRTLSIQGVRRIEDPPDGSYYSGPAQEFLTDIIDRDFDFDPGEAYALLTYFSRTGSFICGVVPLGKRGRLAKFVTKPGETLDIDGTRLDGETLATAASLLNAVSDKEDSWSFR